MGPWETSVNPQLCSSIETYLFIFGFAAGAGKSVFWYVKFLYFHLGRIYRVRQLHNHRRHPCHAESWTRVIGIFLL